MIMLLLLYKDIEGKDKTRLILGSDDALIIPQETNSLLFRTLRRREGERRKKEANWWCYYCCINMSKENRRREDWRQLDRGWLPGSGWALRAPAAGGGGGQGEGWGSAAAGRWQQWAATTDRKGRGCLLYDTQLRRNVKLRRQPLRRPLLGEWQECRPKVLTH